MKNERINLTPGFCRDLKAKDKQYNIKNKLYPKGRSTMGMPGTKTKKGI